MANTSQHAGSLASNRSSSQLPDQRSTSKSSDYRKRDLKDSGTGKIMPQDKIAKQAKYDNRPDAGGGPATKEKGVRFSSKYMDSHDKRKGM